VEDPFEAFCATVERDRPRPDKAPSFWRKADPVMVRADDGEMRVVKGGMWGPQRDWWDLKTFFKVLVGGYGAGKTLIGSKRVIALALQNAPAPVAVVSPTFPLAKQTVIVTIQALLAGKEGLLGREFRWSYNKQDKVFTIHYHGRRATIIVYSGEDPLSLRGPNLAAAWLDEPFIMVQEVFDQMIARVRHPDAGLKEVLLTGTPEQLNWGYDLCSGELHERFAKQGMEVGVVQASTRLNKALDKGYVQRLEGSLSEKAIDAYVEGKFINLARGLVYYGFDPTPGTGNVQERPTPKHPERGNLIVPVGSGMDFNVNPFASCVFWQDGRHIHFFAEHELDNADTEYACSFLREKYWDMDGQGGGLRTVYPDASGAWRHTSSAGGKTDFHYIREAGFDVRANPANPRVRDRENAVNGKLKNKNGEVTLTISPKCKRLIKYLSTYSHELQNKQKAMSHLLDAFGYPISYLFPVVRERARMERLQGA
jgi:hypothetical protein